LGGNILNVINIYSINNLFASLCFHNCASLVY
jgi:hypothetical protein